MDTKILQEIITGNYDKMLWQEIMTRNYDKKSWTRSIMTQKWTIYRDTVYLKIVHRGMFQIYK